MTTKLDAIEARAAAATPGPWNPDVGDLSDVVVQGPAEDYVWIANVGNWNRKSTLEPPADTDRAHQLIELQDANDAIFIAHARTDIPDLLAIARAAMEAEVYICDCGCNNEAGANLRAALAPLLEPEP